MGFTGAQYPYGLDGLISSAFVSVRLTPSRTNILVCCHPAGSANFDSRSGGDGGTTPDSSNSEATAGAAPSAPGTPLAQIPPVLSVRKRDAITLFLNAWEGEEEERLSNEPTPRHPPESKPELVRRAPPGGDESTSCASSPLYSRRLGRERKSGGGVVSALCGKTPNEGRGGLFLIS